MEQKEMEMKFANEGNQYYAHGIGAYDEKVIESIFENGLRCSHNELYWTVIEFGKGSETLFKEKEGLMNNWEHKGSKHIMIASLPDIFHLLDVKGTALFQKRHAAFYNNISQEEAGKLGISPGLYLKPEFVMGMYDAEKKEFVVNDRYYENLPEHEQKMVLDEVKRQYIDIIEHSDWTLKEYVQILDDVGIESPLTPEEISNNGKVEQQLDMVELANGIKIPRKQYEEEYTVEEGTEIDMVELPNGIKIPRKQYEQEYLTGDARTDMVELQNGVKIPRKQYEEEQGTMKQTKGISIGNVKASIEKGKVTSPETQSVIDDMRKRREIKKIQYMQHTGQALTPEQKLLIDEHIRQTQQAQIQFQQRQKNKQRKGNGIEM